MVATHKRHVEKEEPRQAHKLTLNNADVILFPEKQISECLKAYLPLPRNVISCV